MRRPPKYVSNRRGAGHRIHRESWDSPDAEVRFESVDNVTETARRAHAGQVQRIPGSHRSVLSRHPERNRSSTEERVPVAVAMLGESHEVETARQHFQAPGVRQSRRLEKPFPCRPNRSKRTPKPHWEVECLARGHQNCAFRLRRHSGYREEAVKRVEMTSSRGWARKPHPAHRISRMCLYQSQSRERLQVALVVFSPSGLPPSACSDGSCSWPLCGSCRQPC